MATSLRDGLSFCLLGDRIVFLDLSADRYFALSPYVEAVFRRAAAGEALPPGDRTLLVAARLVQPGEAPLSLHCCQPAVPLRSIFEQLSGRPRTIDVAAFAWKLLRARLSLRFHGLARTMTRAARRKGAPASPYIDPVKTELMLARAAAAQRGCARIFGSHDLCLPYAIALANWLDAQGILADIVIAVGMPPFRAHAWVQWQDTLVNECLEIAAHYIPIAVL